MARACQIIPTDLWVQHAIPVPYLRCWKQVQYLRARGGETSVVSWIRWTEGPLARLPADEVKDGIPVRRLHLHPPRGSLVGRARFFLDLSAKVAEAARATQADAFVVHDPELLRAGLKAADGRPVFYDAHEHFPGMVAEHNPREARLVDLLERWAARRLAHVYVTTEGVAERFRAMGVPTTVIWNSRPVAEVEKGTVPREEARKAANVPDGAFVLGFVGSLAGDEGLETILEALRHASPKVMLLAYGGPPKAAQDLQARAASMGLGDRARFPGPFPNRELFARLAAFDAGALLLPNKGLNWETRGPNKLFDYLGAGLPMLASPLGELRRVVEGSGAGLVVDREPKAIARALDALAADPARVEAMRRAGRAAFKATYAWDHMEKRLRDSHPFWR